MEALFLTIFATFFLATASFPTTAPDSLDAPIVRLPVGAALTFNCSRRKALLYQSPTLKWRQRGSEKNDWLAIGSVPITALGKEWNRDLTIRSDGLTMTYVYPSVSPQMNGLFSCFNRDKTLFWLEVAEAQLPTTTTTTTTPEKTSALATTTTPTPPPPTTTTAPPTTSSTTTTTIATKSTTTTMATTTSATTKKTPQPKAGGVGDDDDDDDDKVKEESVIEGKKGARARAASSDVALGDDPAAHLDSEGLQSGDDSLAEEPRIKSPVGGAAISGDAPLLPNVVFIVFGVILTWLSLS